jgi:hypothetical protein
MVAGTLYWRTYYEPNPLTFRVAQIETRLGALDERVRDSAAEIERAMRLREQQGAAVEPPDAGSAPAITCSSQAQSAIERASGPTWSSDCDNGIAPARLTRPQVGLMPLTPHSAAGTRIEPPVSEPSAP